MDDIHQTLLSVGLSEKETEVYLALIQLGSAPASVLGKRTNIRRSTAKYTCEKLAEMGAISKIEQDGTHMYSISSADQLFDLVRRQRDVLDTNEQMLTSILPQLEKALNHDTHLPQVRVFEGREGIIRMHRDVIEMIPKQTEAIYYCRNTDFSIDAEFGLTELNRTIIQKRVQHNVPIQILTTIADNHKHYQKNAVDELRESRLIRNMNFFDAQMHMFILDEHIVTLSFDSEEPFGYMVRSKPLISVHRPMFNLLWSHPLLVKK